jgi:8-oxo-dGTP pyrophosphatase MutT (NUDIX family)
MAESALLAHPMLRRLADHLAERPGTRAAADGAPARAAVALTFRVGDDGEPSLLMIQRAERSDDPWSGHIAFPGGRWSPNDESLEATAIRETREETGIDLAARGLVLGTLDELRPRTPSLPPIIVTPFVAVIEPAVDLVLSDEVAAAFWVPVERLRHPDVARESEVHVRGATWRVPSYVLEERVVWGMTERLLRRLLEVAA